MLHLGKLTYSLQYEGIHPAQTMINCFSVQYTFGMSVCVAACCVILCIWTDLIRKKERKKEGQMDWRKWKYKKDNEMDRQC